MSITCVGVALFRLQRRLAVLVVPLCAAIGRDLRAPDDPGATLSRIRDKVAEHLSLLPNYTCHEVIDRFVQSVRTRGLRQYDRVEVEVAFVGQRELFARPGDAHFQEQPITEMVRTGLIGNGTFGSITANVFLGDSATFEYRGPAEMDGHKTYRYDFQVSQGKSQFFVNYNLTEARVPFWGSFWADSETYDLARIEIAADQMPLDFGLSLVKESVQYTGLQIHDSEFLLPLHGGMETADTSGNITRNDVALQQCHEFTGESSVTFGDPVGSSADRAIPKQ